MKQTLRQPVSPHRELIARMRGFFSFRVWELRLKDRPWAYRYSITTLRIFLLAGQKSIADGCEKTASILTYYSLLNVVPVLAVAFAIAKGFGLQEFVEKQIVHFAEQANWQPEATQYLLTFSHNLLQQAKGGLIAGVGIILLLWTVVSILGKIEESFNHIWEIKKSRSLVRKFSDYMAMMILAPVLMVVSSSATVLLTSKLPGILGSVAVLGFFSNIVLLVLNLLPYVSIWILLIMLYLLMPNGRVPLRSAVLGGIVGGTVTQIAQWAYIKFQIGVASYGAIYGSFAALPLFLGWLQISWMIVLFGAEIAYATEHHESYGFRPVHSSISIGAEKLLIFRVFQFITKRFNEGQSAPTVSQMAGQLEIPKRVVENLLQKLLALRLIVETAKDPASESGFQPGRTIENITLQSVLDEYEKYGVATLPDQQSDDTRKIAGYLKQISETAAKSPGNVRVKDI